MWLISTVPVLCFTCFSALFTSQSCNDKVSCGSRTHDGDGARPERISERQIFDKHYDPACIISERFHEVPVWLRNRLKSKAASDVSEQTADGVSSWVLLLLWIQCHRKQQETARKLPSTIVWVWVCRPPQTLKLHPARCHFGSTHRRDSDRDYSDEDRDLSSPAAQSNPHCPSTDTEITAHDLFIRDTPIFSQSEIIVPFTKLLKWFIIH